MKPLRKPDKEKIATLLSTLEWSTGFIQGQCPVCKGFGPQVIRYMSHAKQGHVKGCLMAECMELLELEVKYDDLRTY